MSATLQDATSTTTVGPYSSPRELHSTKGTTTLEIKLNRSGNIAQNILATRSRHPMPGYCGTQGTST